MTVLAGYVPTRFGDAVVGYATDEAVRRRTVLVVFNVARGGGRDRGTPALR